MWRHLQQKRLYLVVFTISMLLFITGLGGGLFGQEGIWITQWQHHLFEGLCHQNPDRSFWIGGTPMAVCSRCIGIYSSFFLTWIGFPWFTDVLQILNRYIKEFLIVIILLNVADIAGNLLGFWTNTLTSRFFMGSLVGISAVLGLGRAFIKSNSNINKIQYGTG